MKDLKRFSPEWWKNYWFYYKWHTLIAVISVCLIVGSVYSALTRVTPDFSILFSGNFVLSEADHDTLISRAEMAISDVNHDKKTVAQFLEIPLKLDSEHVDETTAASNVQMQMQFATGEHHILVLDRELFDFYNAQDLLDTDTLCIDTKDCPFFEGTELAQMDAVMVTRHKRRDYESDFTTSEQFINYWVTKQ